jgi:hypothetical protein
MGQAGGGLAWSWSAHPVHIPYRSWDTCVLIPPLCLQQSDGLGWTSFPPILGLSFSVCNICQLRGKMPIMLHSSKSPQGEGFEGPVDWYIVKLGCGGRKRMSQHQPNLICLRQWNSPPPLCPCPTAKEGEVPEQIAKNHPRRTVASWDRLTQSGKNLQEPAQVFPFIGGRLRLSEVQAVPKAT